MGGDEKMPTNIIAINRGDTYVFNLTINDESAEDGIYRLTGNDAVYFGLMDPNQPFEEALIKKRLTAESPEVDESGNIIFVINPEDTLDLLPGRYFYMIKLKMDHYDEDSNQVKEVRTIINKTKFVIYD